MTDLKFLTLQQIKSNQQKYKIEYEQIEKYCIDDIWEKINKLVNRGLAYQQAKYQALEDQFSCMTHLKQIKNYEKNYFQNKKLIEKYEKQGGYNNESIRSDYIALKIQQAYYKDLNIYLMKMKSAIYNDKDLDSLRFYQNQYQIYSCMNCIPMPLIHLHVMYYAQVNKQSGDVIIKAVTLNSYYYMYYTDQNNKQRWDQESQQKYSMDSLALHLNNNAEIVDGYEIIQLDYQLRNIMKNCKKVVTKINFYCSYDPDFKLFSF